MIITVLLNLIYGLLSLLLVFNLPVLPETITTLVNSILGYIPTGVGILGVFFGNTCMGVLALLLRLVIGMNAAYMTYSLVFWVIRKIPMLNVKE